jgi:hypothetical protein
MQRKPKTKDQKPKTIPDICPAVIASEAWQSLRYDQRLIIAEIATGLRPSR